MKFKIKNKNYEMKYGIRAMMMYENITNHSFAPTTMTDVVTFLYCIVITSTEDYSYTFDDFIDALDKHPEMLNEFTEWLNTVIAVQNNVKKN